MKKIYSEDRFEGDLAVLVCDDETVLNVSKDTVLNFDLREGDVFSAKEINGDLCDIMPMPEERQKREAVARKRLERLLSRKKEEK